MPSAEPAEDLGAARKERGGEEWQWEPKRTCKQKGEEEEEEEEE